MNIWAESQVQKSFGRHHFATDDLNKSQKLYELILVDSNSVSLTHTMDKYNPQQILYSKCIIRDVITAQEWKNPFEDRKFSIHFTSQAYNYNDYKNAWYRAFLMQPNIHSWFFMNNVQIPFQYGSTIGGLCLDV